MQNIILSSIKNSFSLVWKNKTLFLVLFIIQILFLAVLSFVNLHYVTKMMESSQAIYDYLNKLHLDESKVSQDLLEQKNILGDDPLLISRNFNEIVKNFRIFVVAAFVLVAFFISLSWALSAKFIEKIKIKELSALFIKNLSILAVYFGLILLFLFSMIDVSIMQLTSEGSKFFTKLFAFLIVSAILCYFMFISLSLSRKHLLKDLLQKTLVVGIKKVHYVAVFYLINIIFFVIPLFLSFYFFDKNIFIFFLLLAKVIFGIVFSRILLIESISKFAQSA